MRTEIHDVESFWCENLNGAQMVEEQPDIPAFYLSYERHRYQSEPYNLEQLDLDRVAGKTVVEVGSGLGTDGTGLARAGANYIGVDVTPNGAALTQGNLRFCNIPGSAINASAERIPLASGSVDYVYSHGVIHHTPDIDQAVAEIHRILKPGGEIHLMLYHKSSFNYWVSIGILRRFGALLLMLPGGISLASRLTKEAPDRLAVHKKRFERQGFGYLFGPNWLNRNTDGPNNPLARAYSRKSAISLLAGFTDFRFEVTNLNRRHLPVIGPMLPASVERDLAARIGWHLHIFARKAA